MDGLGKLISSVSRRNHGSITSITKCILQQKEWRRWSNSSLYHMFTFCGHPSIVSSSIKTASLMSSSCYNNSNDCNTNSTRQSVRYSSSTKQWDQQQVVYDSNDTTTTNNNNDSAKKRFHEMPMLPFIRDRIVELGVGIKPRTNFKKTAAAAARSNNKNKGGGPVLISEAEERMYFAEQANRTKSKIASSHHGIIAPRRGKHPTKHTNKPATDRLVITSCIPPPPFGPSHSKVTTHYFKTKKSSTLKKVLIQTCTVRKPVKILKSVASITDEFIKSTTNLPEIALAGRSNVGKSTLLNALLYGNQFETRNVNEKSTTTSSNRRRGAVKMPSGIKAITSARPGETKEITFYQLSSHIIVEQLETIAITPPPTTTLKYGATRNKVVDTANNEESKSPATTNSSSSKQKHSVGLILADLPGYGFAYASEERAKEWKTVMKHYLVRGGCKRILLLIDARHGFKDADYEFLSNLEDATTALLPTIQIVLTKCDLVTQADLVRRVVQVQQQLSEALRRESGILPVMMVSAKPGIGFNNIRQERARGGIFELQRDLARLVPDTTPRKR